MSRRCASNNIFNSFGTEKKHIECGIAHINKSKRLFQISTLLLMQFQRIIKSQ